MKSDPRDESASFEERTRAAFDASVEALDGRTRSKLTQARHAAAEELRRRGAQPWRRKWAAASGAMAAVVLAVWLGVQPASQMKPEVGEFPLDEWEMVAESPNFDLLEDVEFYAWIASQPLPAENPSG